MDETRNQVSRDIKILEEYLQGLKLQAEFRLSLGKGFVLLDGQGFCDGSATGEIEEEALVWGPSSSGQYRLFYEVSRWEGSVDVDAAEFNGGSPLFWDESTLKQEQRPLIEAKFEIRKKMYPKLPEFVSALARHLAVDPSQLSGLDEDLPF